MSGLRSPRGAAFATPDPALCKRCPSSGAYKGKRQGRGGGEQDGLPGSPSSSPAPVHFQELVSDGAQHLVPSLCFSVFPGSLDIGDRILDPGSLHPTCSLNPSWGFAGPGSGEAPRATPVTRRWTVASRRHCRSAGEAAAWASSLRDPTALV